MLARVLKSSAGLEELVETFKSVNFSLLQNAFEEPTEIDLFQYTKKCMFIASTTAIFGKAFPNEEIYKDYAKFELGISHFMKGYPSLVDREAYKARDGVHKQMKEFFKDPSKVSQSSMLITSHLKVC